MQVQHFEVQLIFTFFFTYEASMRVYLLFPESMVFQIYMKTVRNENNVLQNLSRIKKYILEKCLT